MSKSRILKKKKAQARAVWLADHLGCIKRGTLVEYFKKHPKELSKVQSVSRSQHYDSRAVNLLKRDIKTNWHHPGFDAESKEDTINKMDIKNNSIKLTLHCVEPKNLRSSYSTMTMTVKQGDLITAGWKLNDKLRYVDDCKFYKCKDVDGLEYTKSATIGVFAIPQTGYFKKVEE